MALDSCTTPRSLRGRLCASSGMAGVSPATSPCPCDPGRDREEGGPDGESDDDIVPQYGDRRREARGEDECTGGHVVGCRLHRPRLPASIRLGDRRTQPPADAAPIGHRGARARSRGAPPGVVEREPGSVVQDGTGVHPPGEDDESGDGGHRDGCCEQWLPPLRWRRERCGRARRRARSAGGTRRPRPIRHRGPLLRRCTRPSSRPAAHSSPARRHSTRPVSATPVSRVRRMQSSRGCSRAGTR